MRISKKNIPYGLQSPIILATIIITSVLFLRLAKGNFDVTYFILLSEKQTVPEALPFDVTTNFAGASGYDGQFFFRYALNPFSKDIQYEKGKGGFGILVDNCKYRRTRVGYPLLAWGLALGQKSLIPISLVLVNLLAFIILVWACSQVCHYFQVPIYYALFPLWINGLHYSYARDLSDLVACSFLALSYLFFLKKRWPFFILVGTLALLTREATAFFLLPVYIMLFFEQLKAETLSRKLKKVIPLFFPWLLFLSWSLFLSKIYPTQDGLSTINSFKAIFNIPLAGLLSAFSIFYEKYPLQNLLLDWLPHIIWTIWLFFISIKIIWKTDKKQWHSWPVYTLLVSLLLSFSYSNLIYEDPWSFVRVLAPTHLFCFFLLIEFKEKLNKGFVLFSCLLILLTFVKIVLLP